MVSNSEETDFPSLLIFLFLPSTSGLAQSSRAAHAVSAADSLTHYLTLPHCLFSLSISFSLSLSLSFSPDSLSLSLSQSLSLFFSLSLFLSLFLLSLSLAVHELTRNSVLVMQAGSSSNCYVNWRAGRRRKEAARLTGQAHK
jgi:hypothetical protein